MENPTRDEIYTYQEILASMEAGARSELLVFLATLNLDIPETWPLVEELLRDLMVAYGTASHQLGETFYEMFRGDYGHGLYDHTATASLAEQLVNDAHGLYQTGERTRVQVGDMLSNALGYHIQAENRETVLAGIEREKMRTGRRVGYARVPRPDCSCAFCIVMAGRGFVYRDRQTAGQSEGDKFHSNCRCTVVALDDTNPVIDGYDERTYEELYERARDALAADDVPDEVTSRISSARLAAERAGRDFRPLNEIEIMMRYQNEGMH